MVNDQVANETRATKAGSYQTAPVRVNATDGMLRTLLPRCDGNGGLWQSEFPAARMFRMLPTLASFSFREDVAVAKKKAAKKAAPKKAAKKATKKASKKAPATKKA